MSLKHTFENHRKKIFAIIFLALIIIVLATDFYGSTDNGDYLDIAKFFSGSYSADIRSSHSYLYGILHAPILMFIPSFIVFKVTSLIFLSLIIYSVYILSGKDKRALWLILLSPLVWFIAPWASPIQLATLCLLWSHHFMQKYNEHSRLKYLCYSALLIGLGWAVWDTILYFGFIMGFVFLFNKKMSHSLIFLIFLSIGLLPRFALDYILFGFPFYSLIKTFVAGFVSLFGGSIYQTSDSASWVVLNSLGLRAITLILAFLCLPLASWKYFSPHNFNRNTKTNVFIILSLIIILSNPQLRYFVAFAPILTLNALPFLTHSSFKKQITVFAILTALVMVPYAIQLTHTPYYKGTPIYEGIDIATTIGDIPHLTFSRTTIGDELSEDINKIVGELPKTTFIVGNAPDDYALLARNYWGDDVTELVSIQDYNLFINNQTFLFLKEFEPKPRVPERRAVWVQGGLKKNVADSTDYMSIDYAIGVGRPIELEGFSFVKQQGLLYLSKKT